MNKVLWFDYAFCCVFFCLFDYDWPSQWTFPADRSISWCEMNERKNGIYRLMVFNQLLYSVHFGCRLKLCTVSASYAMHRRQFFILFSIFFSLFSLNQSRRLFSYASKKKPLKDVENWSRTCAQDKLKQTRFQGLKELEWCNNIIDFSVEAV